MGKWAALCSCAGSSIISLYQQDALFSSYSTLLPMVSGVPTCLQMALDAEMLKKLDAAKMESMVSES